MKFFFVFGAIFSCVSLFAQGKITPKDSCICTTEIKLNTPVYAEEDSVSAQVIVEIDIDSDCRYLNPVILKGASAGRNKVALDYAQQFINGMNKCKCPRINCTKRKKVLPIKFISEVVE